MKNDISATKLADELGSAAAIYYINRVFDLIAQGQNYKEPYKLALMWAVSDKRKKRGFYKCL